MAAKMILALCASALLVQATYSQCAAGPWGLAGSAGWNGFAGPGLGLAGSGLGLAGPGLGLAGPGLGLAGPGLGLASGYGVGCGCGGVASTGGGLAVSSASPVAPVGVSVLSTNAYEGVLTAGGNLPFLGTVGIEGVTPTAGAGAISYGCGSGAVAITAEEGPIATGIAPSAGIAGLGVPGLAGLGYNGLGYNGLAGAGYGPAGCGCGYGAIL